MKTPYVLIFRRWGFLITSCLYLRHHLLEIRNFFIIGVGFICFVWFILYGFIYVPID